MVEENSSTRSYESNNINLTDSSISLFGSENEYKENNNGPPKEIVVKKNISAARSTKNEKKTLLKLISFLFMSLVTYVKKRMMRHVAAFFGSSSGKWLMKTRIIRMIMNSGAASDMLVKLPPGAASLMAHLIKTEAPPVYTMPHHTDLLRLSQLSREYYAGEGDNVWCLDKFGKPQKVVDFVGGQGTNLLGHNNEELKEAAINFFQSPAISISDQGSTRTRGEHTLAYQLSQLVGEHTGGKEYMVRFASTGAEAVEMSLAHACLEREEKLLTFLSQQKLQFGAQEPELLLEIEAGVHHALNTEKTKVLTLKGGCHGNTLGGRSIIGNPSIRAPFKPMMGMEPIVLPIDDSAADVDVDEIVQNEMVTVPALKWGEDGKPQKTTFSFSRVVAAIAEPILGEGGVCLPNRDILTKLRGHGFPVVFDEIQCGMGRSGQFLASEGLDGDYYVFAKALGGGVTKISALLIAKDRYIERFDNLYSSTFAGDNFSCTIAQKVLEIIKRDNIPQRCKERGEILKERCIALQKKYPRIIKAVTGQGLMLGIEINTEITEDVYALRTCHSGDRLGWCFATYLLNRESIRVLPTLSAPTVLRLEPSAYIDNDTIDSLISGFTNLCEAVLREDVLHLFGFVLDGEMVRKENLLKPPMKLPPFCPKIEEPHPDAERVLFVGHNVSPDVELEWMHPEWRALSPIARVELMRQIAAVVDFKATFCYASNIFNNKVWIIIAMVPFDAVQMLAASDNGGEKVNMLRSIEQALEVGKSKYGCKVGVLGGFTSIIADNGMSVRAPAGMRLSTGNSFTVAVGMRRLQDYTLVEKKIDVLNEDTRVAIVGATGNIGRSIAQQIIRKMRITKMTLISRTISKLEKLKEKLLSVATEMGVDSSAYDIKCSTDMSDMAECNIIVIALATGKPIVYPEHLHQERQIVLADLSVPSSVTGAALKMPNLNQIPIGGTVALPGESDFVLHPLLEMGTVYCCCAEGILLSLEPAMTKELDLKGDIDQESVDILSDVAEKHVFFEKLGTASYRPPNLSD